MNSYKEKFFYKRNNTLNGVKISCKNKDKLHKGDTMRFKGKIYSDRSFKKEVGTADVIYIIILVTPNKVLLKCTTKFSFYKTNKHGEGDIICSGNILSENFYLKDGHLSNYKVKSSNLGFIIGSKKYEYSYGDVKYKINENATGEINLNLKIIK
jgi:hypothetical protein